MLLQTNNRALISRLSFVRPVCSVPNLSELFPISTWDIKPKQQVKNSLIDDSDSKVVSNVLLRQAKMVHTAGPGIFSLSPILNRVLQKVCCIIEEEMTVIGAQKVMLPVLGPAEIWKKSGRWHDMGSELLKVADRNGKNYCLSPTHEELVTTIVASHSPLSYRQLPIKIYQIGRKFRDEGRPKNGLLRCREFEMKDLYTFDASVDDAKETYSRVTRAYKSIFERLSLDFVHAEAVCGQIGGLSSHEFHVLAPSGEDQLFYCGSCGSWFNKEFVEADETFKCGVDQCNKKNFTMAPGIEIAHTFLLGKKYSNTFNANFTRSNGKKENLVMGCYGVGVTRLLSAILEVKGKEDEISWPPIISPYQTLIIPQKEGYRSDETFRAAQTLANELVKQPNLKNEVVIDDRLTLSIGQRVAMAKKNSFPSIIVVGKKALETPPYFEVIDNSNNSCEFLTLEETVSRMKYKCTLPLGCL